MRSHRVALVLLALAGAVALLVPGAEARCRQFSWSLGHRIDLFTSGPLPTVESGQWLPRDGVFRLKLRPVRDVVYPVPPERGSDSGYGGTVAIERLPAGRWQVLLTQEALLDAVQEHTRVPVRETSRSHDCPGVVQALTYDLLGEPLTLQLGGVAVDRLGIAVVRVWNFGGKEW
jgi:hypothetical protein